MSSKNNIFPLYQDNVITRYKRTVGNGITGKRLLPDDNNKVVTFVLQGSPSYEHDVVEIYTEREAKAFVHLNRKLFESGSIAEYTEEQERVEMYNALTDTEVEHIANLKTKKILEEKLQKITSVITLKRILAASTSTINGAIIEARIDELT